jgi:hypothetical protein
MSSRDSLIQRRPQSRGLETPRYPAITAIFGSADERVSQRARLWLVPLLVVLGSYAIVVGAAVSLFNDGDTLTHIVIGR